MVDPTSKYWICVLNNFEQSDVEDFDDFIRARCDYAIYQLEMGENGTPHVQGYICLKKKMKFSTLKNSLGDEWHLEKRNKSHAAAKKYCMKDDTRLDGPFEYGSDENIPKGAGERTDLIKIKKALDAGEKCKELVQLDEHFGAFAKHTRFFKDYEENLRQQKFNNDEKKKFQQATLRIWQKELVKKLEKQDDRKLLWCWDDKGNVGKSWLARWLEVTKGAFLCEVTAHKDIAYAYDFEEFVVFDVTRSKKEFLNYDTIEKFKDGRLFSSKYESKMKRFKPCKVVVFANFPPDETKLSDDRWDFFTPNIVDLRRPRVEVQPEKRKKKKIIISEDENETTDEEADFEAISNAQPDYEPDELYSIDDPDLAKDCDAYKAKNT